MHWTNLNYFLVPFWINSKTSNLNFLLWINQRNTVVDFINKCSAHCKNKKQRLVEDIKSYICWKNFIQKFTCMVIKFVGTLSIKKKKKIYRYFLLNSLIQGFIKQIFTSSFSWSLLCFWFFHYTISLAYF